MVLREISIISKSILMLIFSPPVTARLHYRSYKPREQERVGGGPSSCCGSGHQADTRGKILLTEFLFEVSDMDCVKVRQVSAINQGVSDITAGKTIGRIVYRWDI